MHNLVVIEIVWRESMLIILTDFLQTILISITLKQQIYQTIIELKSKDYHAKIQLI
jgi:hypothetical protein